MDWYRVDSRDEKSGGTKGGGKRGGGRGNKGRVNLSVSITTLTYTSALLVYFNLNHSNLGLAVDSRVAHFCQKFLHRSSQFNRGSSLSSFSTHWSYELHLALLYKTFVLVTPQSRYAAESLRGNKPSRAKHITPDRQ